MTDPTTSRAIAVGVFRDRRDAQQAMDDLWAAGFRDDEMGILARADEASEGAEGVNNERDARARNEASAGVVIGGILGAAASLLIPGVGTLVAGGILAGVVGGAAVGAIAGGIAGFLVGLGMPEKDARYYEGEVHAGRVLVTVRTASRYDEVRDILRRDGAYDVENQAPTS